MYVPRINKTFIEWVTDYACLNKNDDIFGVFPTTDGLQESRNVFALMKKNYDILTHFVRIQADHLYQKSKKPPKFKDFKLSST